MANRRLGVEHQVKDFEVRGTRELPDPGPVPSVEESINGIQEFRPDFRRLSTSPTVRPFLDQVTEDVTEAWEAGLGKLEPGVDRKKVSHPTIRGPHSSLSSRLSSMTLSMPVVDIHWTSKVIRGFLLFVANFQIKESVEVYWTRLMVSILPAIRAGWLTSETL